MSFDYEDGKRNRSSGNAYDYNHFLLNEPAPNKTSKFMTVSAIVHAGLFIAIGMLAVPLIEEAKVETITIEIAEPVRLPSKGINTPVTRGAPAQPVAKEDITPVTKDDVVVAKTLKQTRAEKVAAFKAAKAAARAEAKQAKVAAVQAKAEARAAKLAARADAKAQAKAAKVAAKSVAKSAKAIAVARPVKAAPAAAPQLATIDDIDAPEIDKVAEEAKHSWEPAAFSDDMDDDLEKVNHKQAKALAAEKNKIEQDADQLDAENEKALDDAASSTKSELATIDSNNQARRARDAQAIAAASASEKAAQDQAAREAAAQAAAEASAAAAREAAGREAARQKLAAAAAAKAAAEAGRGAGKSGSPAQGVAAGVPSGVRSLDQLRQKPGNPVPQYARDERLQGHHGQVTYVAYVKKDGSLANFRQVTTTGYKNLDSKTLQALQQWKFYPGQEGWVELPFRWDLKGGAQSVDGLLRVKRSDLSQM